MPKVEPSEFRTIAEYQIAAETLCRLSGRLLFGFAGTPTGTKGLVIQNFIARTIKMVRGILALWDMDDIQDCWILHRSLCDRYFHLVDIGRSDSYRTFDDWSFMRQYEAQNRVRSDTQFRDTIDPSHFTPTPEQKARYAALVKSPPQWKRPKAEDVAKRLSLPFLYTYGYDIASTHVHPMSTDGHEDFYSITRLEPTPDFPSQIAVIHNTLLFACLLVQEALNQSDLRSRAIVNEFLEHIMQHIETGSDLYKSTFLEIANLGPDAELCKK